MLRRWTRPLLLPSTAVMTMVIAVLLFIDVPCCAQPLHSPVPTSSSAFGTDETGQAGIAVGQSSRELRSAAIAALPMGRLTPTAKQRIAAVVDRPTLFRHLPTQSLDCDPDLFLFIARHPEILVGIWEVMGITQVRTERIDEYRLHASDGSGTHCTLDLVYGDRSTHVYVADGYYDGKLVAAPLTGKGVFILRTQYKPQPDGLVIVEGTLDCFIQLENLGADLIARTLGPLIGKTADNNFIETAKFIDQIGISARRNPEGLADLGSRLPQVDDATRKKFVETVVAADQRNQARMAARSLPRSAERPDTVLPFR